MSDVITLELRAVGVWTPGFADADAWAQREVAGASELPVAQAPRAELLPPMLRRRTSLMTRMAAEVAAQAIARAGFDAAAVAMIYGSVYGEIRTTLDLLEALLVADAPLSPTKFHNSVHNTAGGYVSISTKNRGGNAALTAGRSTLAMGLLECAGLLGSTPEPAVLVLAEESLPEPLADGRAYGPLAAAFALGREGGPAVAGSLSVRTCRLRQGMQAEADVVPGVPAALAENPCVVALTLADMAMRAQGSVVALEPHRARGWLLELGPRREGPR